MPENTRGCQRMHEDIPSPYIPSHVFPSPDIPSPDIPSPVLKKVPEGKKKQTKVYDHSKVIHSRISRLCYTRGLGLKVFSVLFIYCSGQDTY